MGDFLTRAWVWVAMLGYCASTVLLLRGTRVGVARWIWAFGALAFLVHVCCAFHYFHDWSHTAALIETARQTKELTGFDSGSGLYLNYLFTLWWLTDAGWWLAVGDSRYNNRPSWITLALHGFFVFMIVNGAIVFGRGPVRWYGTTVVAVIALAWVRRARGQSQPDT